MVSETLWLPLHRRRTVNHGANKLNHSHGVVNRVEKVHMKEVATGDAPSSISKTVEARSHGELNGKQVRRAKQGWDQSLLQYLAPRVDLTCYSIIL